MKRPRRGPVLAPDRHRMGAAGTIVAAVTAAVTAAVGGGCAGAPSTLDARGAGAETIASLTWVLTVAGGAVLLLVTGLMLYPMWRERRGGTQEPEESEESEARGRRRFLLGGGLFTGLVLAAVFALSIVDLVALGEPEGGPGLTIHVTGHRWWWEATYPEPGEAVVANEIHIPVGVDVRLVLESADVIHSFWVPQLGGKIDLIPGKTNATWLRAEEPGVYRGQCAEFCGAQHANMGLLVVARPEAEFEAWLERQRSPAPEPATALERRGRDAFMSTACVDCHTIRGTPADGELGPDLTHFGGRRTLAAATYPNERGWLEAWIVDAQSLKPGNLMPAVSDFDGRTLRAVAAYLESLR